jgi:hypothetical protein
MGNNDVGTTNYATHSWRARRTMTAPALNYQRMCQMSYAQLAQKLGVIAMERDLQAGELHQAPRIVENLYKSGSLTLEQPMSYEPDPCDDQAVPA